MEKLLYIKKNLGESYYLVFDKKDLFYITGIDIEGLVVLFAKNIATVFCSKMLAGQVSGSVKGVKVQEISSLKDVIVYLKKQKCNSLSVDFEKVSHKTAEVFNKHFKLLDSGCLISKMRQIKRNDEKMRIKKSCEIASGCIKHIKPLLKKGVSEIEISLKIKEYFAKHGVEPAFPPIVAFGSNSALPHHIVNSTRLKENDVALIDLGCVYKGYCSDLTRTFFLGKITKLKEQVFDLVRDAQSKALRALSGSIRARDVDNISRTIVDRGGYGRFFIHGTGHSLGLEVHEQPVISRLNDTFLAPGMVITIEPGVYLPKKFGVRIEDTVLIKKKSYEVLTK